MPTTKVTASGVGGDGANGDDYGGSNGHGPKRDIPVAKFGVWLFIGSLAMIFAALVSAYLYRIGEKPDYRFAWPSSLWINTWSIILSSITLYVAQVSVSKGNMRKGLGFLGATLALGWVFVISQLVGWLLLTQAGIYAQSNPFAGLLFILTSVHGVHLLGGIGWLIYLYYLAKLGIMTPKQHLCLDLGSLYWHFMTIVWLVFFVLIVI